MFVEFGNFRDLRLSMILLSEFNSKILSPNYCYQIDTIHIKIDFSTNIEDLLSISKVLSLTNCIKYITIENFSEISNQQLYNIMSHCMEYFMKIQSLILLKLINININYEAATNLETLIENTTTLKKLYINDCEYCDDQLERLFVAISKNNTITKLDLKFSYFTDDDILSIISMLESNTKLKKLNLSNTNLNGSDIVNIIKSITCKNSVTDLNISKNNFGISSKKIINVLTKTNIRKLKISNMRNIESDFSVDIVKHSKSIRYLTYLDVSKNKITEDNYAQIANLLLVNNNLKGIKLSAEKYESYKIGSTSSALFGQMLRSNTALERLDLSNTFIDTPGIIDIINSLESNTVLESLNLSKNLIDDYAATAIADMIRTTKHLKRFYLLSHTNMSAKSAVLITKSVSVNESLDTFHINCVSFSTKTIDKIIKLLNLNYNLVDINICYDSNIINNIVERNMRIRQNIRFRKTKAANK